MFGFFNRVFSNWSGDKASKRECACGYADKLVCCPYCINDDTNQSDKNLGLNRHDINFYFAAISVCSPFMTPFGLHIDTARLTQKTISSIPLKSQLLTRTSLLSRDDQDSVTAATGPLFKLESESQSSVGSRRGQAITPQAQSKDTSPAWSKKEDYMNLFVDGNGPQERYYTPKASRAYRCSTFPDPVRKSSLAEQKAPSMASTAERQRSSSMRIPEEKSDVIERLRRVLEDYRMIVTNSTAMHTTAFVPENKESIIVSRQCSDDDHITTLNTSISNFSIHSSDISKSPSFDSSKPIPLVMTIPASEISYDMRTSCQTQTTISTGQTYEPSGLIHRLLSSTPELEQELRERAADIWGTAIGLDCVNEKCLSMNDDNPLTLLKQSSVISGTSTDYTTRRDQLKQQIKQLLTEMGLLEKFEKEFTVVENGNSKFHQAQQVIPGLWVGPFYTASNRLRLYSLGITHIVCCVNIQPPFARDFHYIVLPCEDKSDQNILRFFLRSNHFIKTALMDGGRVLVHCGAGISRAPTVCAAFLIQELKVSSDLAIRLVQAARPFADPNEGFKKQLKTFERIVHMEWSLDPNDLGSDFGSQSMLTDENNGTFVDSNKEEDKDTVESSQNEIQKLEEIESENSEISNDDSMLVNLNPSSLEIQSSIGKYEALDSHQSTSLQLWSTSHSRCDFGPFKSDAASAPYLTSLIMSSSLLARQLERSSYNKEIIKSHESFSKQNNDDHIQRNIFSGRSATALPCCLECLPSSPNINTFHKEKGSPHHGHVEQLDVVNDKPGLRSRSLDHLSHSKFFRSFCKLDSCNLLSESDVCSGRLRYRSNSDVTSFSVPHSDFSYMVIRPNLSTSRETPKAARKRKRRREALALASDAVSRAQCYSVHLTGVDTEPFGDIADSVEVKEI